MSWLYIAGRGHSGSTFLDIVLGNSKQIESYGEIISAINRLEADCSCGQQMKECPFWEKVMDLYTSKDNNWERDFKLLQSRSNAKYWPKLFLFNTYGKKHKRLVSINRELHEAITKYHPTKWVLDSSKEPTRSLFLLLAEKDARLIHIIRNPFDVVNSYKKRFIKHGYFKFFRKIYRSKSSFALISFIVGISWGMGNFMVELNALKCRKRVLRVKHENVLSDFDNTMKLISNFLDENLDDIIVMNNKKQPFVTGHNIGGNQIRSNKGIVLENSKASTKLTKWEVFIVRISTFPLRWVYGYKGKPQ